MKIEKYRKLKENIYEVTIDNIKVKLYDDIILKYNLLNLKEIDIYLFNQMIDENDYKKAYYKCLKYIGIKLRSERELINYLKRNDYPDKVIEETISLLKKEGYLNRQLYLSSYINDQINLSVNGPYKIRKNLINLGFLENEIDQELSKVNQLIWDEKVSKIISKRIKLNKKDSLKVFKDKLRMYLYNLGYSNDMIDLKISDISFTDTNRLEKDLDILKTKLSRKYEGDKLKFYLKQKLISKGYQLDEINKYLD